MGMWYQCPVCTSPQIRRSNSDWWRWLLRPLFIYPIRCGHCRHKFFRFYLFPPPVTRKRTPGSSPAVPPDPPAPSA